jgi:hypothetical protein
MKLHCASYDKLFTFLNLHKILFIALDFNENITSIYTARFCFHSHHDKNEKRTGFYLPVPNRVTALGTWNLVHNLFELHHFKHIYSIQQYYQGCNIILVTAQVTTIN